MGADPNDPAEAKRRSARVTRLLNRLHAHGYIAKVPRTHRWHVTGRGRAVMSAVIDIRENAFPVALSKAACPS
jgi:DNA-binding IclR family transcriptional regulator